MNYQDTKDVVVLKKGHFAPFFISYVMLFHLTTYCWMI
jgi:hypothetical protein